MVSSSNLPRPGTLSDPSEPLAGEPGRSERHTTWHDAGDRAAAVTTPETVEATGTPDTTSTIEVVESIGPLETTDAVGSVEMLDQGPGGADETEGSRGPAFAASPFHWVLGAHWLGRWRTPVAIRLWRYGAGSVVAFATSTVVLFVCLTWAHLGAISATVIAFLAGAIPNWVLNRRWAWEKRGRNGMVKETTLYVIVSLTALVASSATDKFTAVEATHLHSNLEKDLLVTFAYMFSVVVLTGLKYVAYDRLVFVDRRRSRNQVLSTTEQNR